MLGLTMEYKFWVYMVASQTGTLYIGMTNNIERRMSEHKSGEFEGFAREYGCNRLVYYESFDEVQKAINREKQLKGWVRRKKIALIESMNPRWADLAERWAPRWCSQASRLRAGENSLRQHRPGERRGVLRLRSLLRKRRTLLRSG